MKDIDPPLKQSGSKVKEKAAHGSSGQDQEPVQARPESSTTWDTDQHSDAPGPFGTGDE